MRCFATTKKDSSETSAASGTNASTKDSTTLAASPSTTHRDKKGDKDIPLEAHFKNPIVATLWAARQEAKLRLGLSDDSRGGGSNTTEVTKAAAQIMAAGKPNETTTSTTTPPDALALAKTSAESQTEISYSFSTDQILKEAYQNPWGEMRFGKILEDLDALAGNIAFQHVFGTPLIVTAGVDRIRLRKRPRIDKDVHLSGKVTWVGSSSMEIRMQCADLDTREEWLEAYFTFVTLDPVTKKPIAMPALLPTTQEERAQFELGALKAQAKKRARRDKLQVGKPLTENSLKMDSLAASLLEEAGPLIRMPSLADPHSILMHNTKMQNAMVAQPQMQNLHNRIFGGFLMRRAFELALPRPTFSAADDQSFWKSTTFRLSPLSILVISWCSTRVLYTLPEGGFLGDYLIDHANLSLVMMEVEAWVTEPEKASARVSNHFYFTFALPKGAMCRKVLPSNIDEARRMASRMTADREQATLRS
ncbi:acyl-CoA hydrolase [Fragilaria crotonensis]|nr:acyl-CoA hydrolase [Fragilaria crotonensis]